MKSDIHPAYDYVAFRDINTREVIVTRSTLTSDKTIEVDGREYPLVDVEITAASHPFWTGTKRAIDTAGRIEKFNERYGKAAARGKSA